MLGLRPFQIVLLAGSLFIFLGSIAFLSVYRPDPDEDILKITDEVMIWGTLDRAVIDRQLRKITGNNERFSSIKYREYSEEEFIPEFVDALAEGQGPDLIVIPHYQLVELRSKLYALSYDFYTERTFKDTYIEGAEIFALSDGIYALPFAADPLIMYWNRDIFSNSNIAVPPRTWETLRNDTVPRLTRTGGAFDIIQSAVALGEYRNIRNALPILSMLMLQSGSNMVIESQDNYQIALQRGRTSGTGAGLSPGTASLSFYTEFANPASSLYSWNRSLPEDRQRFLSGDLALYFGLGSEVESLQRANPNLNFDVAQVPQGATASTLRNYAVFYGLAIPKQAKDVGVSYQVAATLVAPESAKTLAEGVDMAVVHRSTQAAGSIDQFQQVRNEAALIARGWLEPTRKATEQAFQTMVEDVTSGRIQVTGAINDAVERLRLAFE